MKIKDSTNAENKYEFEKKTSLWGLSIHGLKRFFYQSEISDSGKKIIKVCTIPLCLGRGSWINDCMNRLLKRGNYCKMKLGVAYNLFDGGELLESAICSIRAEVDYVVVIYQNISYTGQRTEVDLEQFLQELQQKGLVDEIYLYELKFEDGHKNEKAKRDIGLKLAKKAGCTHFISMDVDEYYDIEQFRLAKNRILSKKICASAVSVVEYIKEPTHQMINNYSYNLGMDFYVAYFPFIMKIYRFKKQRHGVGFFPCFTDPTRYLNGDERFYLFPSHQIVAHHMSTTRTNLAKKYKNSNFMNSTPERQAYVQNLQQQILEFDFEENKKLLADYSMFNQSFVRKVPNKFGINIKKEEG